jgi:hypothetical protein
MSGMLFEGRAPQGARYPWRHLYWAALGRLAGQLGFARLARRAGIPPAEVQELVAGRIAPTLSVRAAVIDFLIKEGHVQAPRGDRYAPSGREVLIDGKSVPEEYSYGVREPKRDERRALRSQFPDRDRG